MGRYIFRRILQAIPLLIIITIVVFALMQLAPGGPLALYKQNPKVTGEDLARISRNLGLDKPVPIQYFNWLKRLVTGDWGTSFSSSRPVLELIKERMAATFTLMFSSFVISLLIGLPIGILSALKRYSIVDYIVTFFSFFGLSMPVFWFALMLQLLFGLKLGWLPTAGMKDPFIDFELWDRVRHLILPAAVLSLTSLASWSRFMRSSLLEVIGQDYIRTARAKGLSEGKVIRKHALKNALIPVVTIIAIAIPGLFSGAVITETVFAWPGMGRLYFDSLGRLDYPVLMGVLTVTAFLVVIFNLVADIIYGILDPRISYD
ncbi:MAG TPA: diguanylate cyclase [Firmicutes bacterium]|jgi:peptide/nickel transport system permease protein|nr:diguanylate cyclase [Bacillota bacterium]HAW71951.1 diguanylate cyclase [Bacillota bacterium]HAZ22504.1 diguanylate cyclase [Bacillota bacterium]HBE04952.1 diguanylate cyclase [Bacillota bacterium]HBG45027.1 diguanylate cyclase [Bacillota bacterium]